jgi:hypothetical protein
VHQSQGQFTEAISFASLTVPVLAKHDMLSFNPPQLPSAFVEAKEIIRLEANPFTNSYRRAGPDGLDVVRLFLGWYACLPRPTVDCYVLLSSFLGRERIAHEITSRGLGWELHASTKVRLNRLEQSAPLRQSIS